MASNELEPVPSRGRRRWPSPSPSWRPSERSGSPNHPGRSLVDQHPHATCICKEAVRKVETNLLFPWPCLGAMAWEVPVQLRKAKIARRQSVACARWTVRPYYHKQTTLFKPLPTLSAPSGLSWTPEHVHGKGHPVWGFQLNLGNCNSVTRNTALWKRWTIILPTAGSDPDLSKPIWPGDIYHGNPKLLVAAMLVCKFQGNAALHPRICLQLVDPEFAHGWQPPLHIKTIRRQCATWTFSHDIKLSNSFMLMNPSFSATRRDQAGHRRLRWE